MFTFAVLLPAELRQRVVEEYEPSQRALKQRVHIDVSFKSLSGWKKQRQDVDTPTGLGSEPYFFPVIVPPKGALSDNFSLQGDAGQAISTLSYREYLQVAASVIRTLLTAAYRLQPGDSLPTSNTPERDAQGAEHRALMDVIQRGAATDRPSQGGSQALADLDVPNPAPRDLAVRLAEKLTSHYAIVASTHADERVRLSYERTIVPTLDISGRSSGLRAQLKGIASLLLGARPVSITVPLDTAWTARSYHLRVLSEDGLYLGSQECPGLEDYLTEHTARPQRAAMAPPYYRFRRRLGQTYAHFYARFFPEPHDRQRVPQVTFKFYEAPPGSVFRAAVAAVSCATLVWLVGFVSSVGSGNLGTDAPAILLAFPAVAAAWLGFERPSRRLLEGTLTARMSLLVTFIVSLGASAMFMIDRAEVAMPDLSSARLSVLGIDRGSWAALALGAILNAIYICFVYLVRSSTYMRLAARPTSRENLHDRFVQNG
jgi:hypothetical protein